MHCCTFGATRYWRLKWWFNVGDTVTNALTSHVIHSLLPLLWVASQNCYSNVQASYYLHIIIWHSGYLTDCSFLTCVLSLKYFLDLLVRQINVINDLSSIHSVCCFICYAGHASEFYPNLPSWSNKLIQGTTSWHRITMVFQYRHQQ